VYVYFEFVAQSTRFRLFEQEFLFRVHTGAFVLNFLRKVGGLGLFQKDFLFRVRTAAFVL
jgi:hypothetical protein